MGAPGKAGLEKRGFALFSVFYSSPVIRSHTRDSGQHQAYKHHRSEVSGPKRPAPICVGE